MTRPGTHGKDSPREPLDADERALAERLARLGPHGEPPTGLDARILAAAHAATHAANPGHSANAAARRGRRLPLAVGMAASLVLALGLAWQLRPLLDPPPPAERDTADMAAARAVDASPAADAGQASGPGSAAEEAADGKAEAGNGSGNGNGAARSTPLPAPPSAARAAEQPRRASAAAPPQAFPAPAAPAPPPPPPPAPVVREMPPSAPAPMAETAATEAADAANATVRRRAAESQRSLDHGGTEAAQAMRQSSAGADVAHAHDDARLRQAQLERIRALRDAGHATQARDELEAFLERWPGYPVPEDLQPLRR
jgi:resuscitation-promoting factor RpfA